jgi:hypothetical protein
MFLRIISKAICLIIIRFKYIGAFICKSGHLGNRHKNIRNVIDNQMQIFQAQIVKYGICDFATA